MMMTMNSLHRPSTSLSLLDLARGGNNDAWNRLTDLYGPVIFSHVLSKGLSKNDAGDVTQEIFISIHRGLGDFKKVRSGDNFLGWVMTIASRRIADYFRQISKFERAIGGSTGALIAQQAQQSRAPDVDFDADKIKRQLASRAMKIMESDFETKTWRAFYITLVEGKSTQQACEELNMRPGSVRQARARVRKRLIEELGDIL